jgi:hypothetical protein
VNILWYEVPEPLPPMQPMMEEQKMEMMFDHELDEFPVAEDE